MVKVEEVKDYLYSVNKGRVSSSTYVKTERLLYKYDSFKGMLVDMAFKESGGYVIISDYEENGNYFCKYFKCIRGTDVPKPFNLISSKVVKNYDGVNCISTTTITVLYKNLVAFEANKLCYTKNGYIVVSSTVDRDGMYSVVYSKKEAVKV